MFFQHLVTSSSFQLSLCIIHVSGQLMMCDRLMVNNDSTWTTAQLYMYIINRINDNQLHVMRHSQGLSTWGVFCRLCRWYFVDYVEL